MLTTDTANAGQPVKPFFTLENLKEKSGGIFDDFKERHSQNTYVFDDFAFNGKDKFTLILADISPTSPDYYVELSNYIGRVLQIPENLIKTK